MEIVISNLKCNGCVAAITDALKHIQGVKSVEVMLNTNTVKVETDVPVNREAIVKVLFDLGYPEANTENGLGLKLKSYTTCMIGRLKS
jgi:copper chaperone